MKMDGRGGHGSEDDFIMDNVASFICANNYLSLCIPLCMFLCESLSFYIFLRMYSSLCSLSCMYFSFCLSLCMHLFFLFVCVYLLVCISSLSHVFSYYFWFSNGLWYAFMRVFYE